MTDTTHEAPARIWATMMDSECARSGTFVDLKEYPTKPNHDAIEYVRADLVQAAVAAAQIEAAHAIDCGCDPQRGGCANMDFCPKHEVNTILDLISKDAQAALDRVVWAERERGFWAGRSCGGSKAEIDAALNALCQGGE